MVLVEAGREEEEVGCSQEAYIAVVLAADAMAASSYIGFGEIGSVSVEVTLVGMDHASCMSLDYTHPEIVMSGAGPKHRILSSAAAWNNKIRSVRN